VTRGRRVRKSGGSGGTGRERTRREKEVLAVRGGGGKRVGIIVREENSRGAGEEIEGGDRVSPTTGWRSRRKGRGGGGFCR